MNRKHCTALTFALFLIHMIGFITFLIYVAITNDLSKTTAKDFSDLGKASRAFAMFYSRGKNGHCPTLDANWLTLSKSIDGDDKFKDIYVGKFDCTVFRPICDGIGIREYPSLVWMKNGKIVDYYEGEHSVDKLKIYLDEKAKPELKKTTNDTGKLREEDLLQMETFVNENQNESEIKLSTGDGVYIFKKSSSSSEEIDRKLNLTTEEEVIRNIDDHFYTYDEEVADNKTSNSSSESLNASIEYETTLLFNNITENENENEEESNRTESLSKESESSEKFNQDFSENLNATEEDFSVIENLQNKTELNLNKTVDKEIDISETDIEEPEPEVTEESEKETEKETDIIDDSSVNSTEIDTSSQMELNDTSHNISDNNTFVEVDKLPKSESKNKTDHTFISSSELDAIVNNTNELDLNTSDTELGVLESETNRTDSRINATSISELFTNQTATNLNSANDKILQEKINDTQNNLTELISSDKKFQFLELGTTNFSQNLNPDGITLIMLYAPWCHFCVEMQEVLNNISIKYKDFTNITIGEVNCVLPENNDLCIDQLMQGVPTVNVHRNGKLILNDYGGSTVEEVEDCILSHFRDEDIVEFRKREVERKRLRKLEKKKKKKLEAEEKLKAQKVTQ